MIGYDQKRSKIIIINQSDSPGNEQQEHSTSIKTFVAEPVELS